MHRDVGSHGGTGSLPQNTVSPLPSSHQLPIALQVVCVCGGGGCECLLHPLKHWLPWWTHKCMPRQLQKTVFHRTLSHPPTLSFFPVPLLWCSLSRGWEVNIDIPFRTEHEDSIFFLSSLTSYNSLLTAAHYKKKFHRSMQLVLFYSLFFFGGGHYPAPKESHGDLFFLINV